MSLKSIYEAIKRFYNHMATREDIESAMYYVRL
jgi:hypothetical protein